MQVVDRGGHRAFHDLHRGRHAQVSVDAGHVVLKSCHVGGERARHRVVDLLHRADGHAADHGVAERAHALHHPRLEPPLGRPRRVDDRHLVAQPALAAVQGRNVDLVGDLRLHGVHERLPRQRQQLCGVVTVREGHLPEAVHLGRPVGVPASPDQPRVLVADPVDAAVHLSERQLLSVAAGVAPVLIGHGKPRAEAVERRVDVLLQDRPGAPCHVLAVGEAKPAPAAELLPEADGPGSHAAIGHRYHWLDLAVPDLGYPPQCP